MDYAASGSICEFYEACKEYLPAIPYLKMKSGWEICVFPPIGGVSARFSIKTKDTGEDCVSVYLECRHLFIMRHGGAFWEVYPIDGQPERCDVDDVDGLMKLIGLSVKYLEDKNERNDA